MINKKMTALLGSILLLATAMPTSMAHGAGNTDVSGRYYGSAAAYVDAPTLGGVSSFSLALCDLEVLGDGTSPSPLDEGDVNGNPGGAIPDGIFDDGGVGAACHTNNHYSYSDYNTPGCGGDSFANDLLFGGDVWIGASCDWKSTGSPPGFTTCVTNELISGPTVPGLSVCVANLLGGSASGPFLSCGNDGVGDSINYGTGAAGATYLNGAAVDGCDPVLNASAATFVFPYVQETGGPSVAVPTTGTIWQAGFFGGALDWLSGPDFKGAPCPAAGTPFYSAARNCMHGAMAANFFVDPGHGAVFCPVWTDSVSTVHLFDSCAH